MSFDLRVSTAGLDLPALPEDESVIAAVSSMGTREVTNASDSGLTTATRVQLDGLQFAKFSSYEDDFELDGSLERRVFETEAMLGDLDYDAGSIDRWAMILNGIL